jgi:acetylornithine/N-succinyldiaminopimelate aminotransferase
VANAVMPTYARADLAFERGEGVYLYTQDGRRFLDFASGVAVSSLGHAHPHLTAALHAQIDKVLHTSNLYRIAGQERLAQRLVDASFASTAFFCNSGAEAVEAGLKLVRRFHQKNGRPDRYRVVTATNSFHGRTMHTISASRNEKHLDGFLPAVDHFDQVPFGNMNALRAAITDKTAAIIVEPVQGESGINPADPEYLKGLRAAADEFGILLMFDEVQTGMGRTGKLFAYEHSGVAPDVMALAKGLGGGFPIGACLASERVSAVMAPGTHGSTFGGNPLACAAANAVLDVMDEKFLAHVREIGSGLKARLTKLVAAYPGVLKDVRGLGLMIGIEFDKPVNTDVVRKLEEKGLLTVVAGNNVVRFVPPLIVDASHVTEAVKIFEGVCADLARA